MMKVAKSIPFPLYLLGLCILAFGIQALWLGFYLDDWVVLYHIFRGGFPKLIAYTFSGNRPFGAWPWWLGFNLLSYSPLLWQLWGLFLRWLAVVLLWHGFKAIWPTKQFQITLAASVLAVSPIFLQQTNALTFSFHWICLSLFAFSIIMMIQSVRLQKRYFLFSLLGLLTSGLQLFTIEYFVGLELLRPMLLWYILENVNDQKKRLKRTLFYAVPYLLLFVIFVIWRLAFFPTPGRDRNTPEILYGLILEPLRTLIDLVIGGFRDVVAAVLGSWYETYQPASITAAPLANLLSWGVVIFTTVISLIYFLSKLEKEDGQHYEGGINKKIWIGVSFIIMLAGFIPGWSTGLFYVSTRNYSDRFGLAAMLGASLFIVSLVSYLVTKKHKTIIICILIGLATGYHFRIANEFRWSWEVKSRLAWQFLWRIPSLQTTTAIYGDGVLVVGSWADNSFLNFFVWIPFGNEKRGFLVL